MGRTWHVIADGTEHLVVATYNPLFNMGSGTVTVDGRVVDAWGMRLTGLPADRRFEVAGKPAILRKAGMIFENYDLIVDGTVVKPD